MAAVGFPEEAAYWTDDADGDPVIPIAPPVSSDEDLVAALVQELRDHNSVEAWAAARPPYAPIPYFARVAIRWLRAQGYLVVPPITGPPGEHGGLR